jgi:phage gp36-like protein
VTALYCTPADIKTNVAGTDAGTGTCAQLPDEQLTAAITQASTKVSAYIGTDYETDAATPTVTVPPLVVTLTIQLATFYATLTYRKGKDLSAFDPVYLAYQDAMRTLQDIISGLVEIDPTPPGDPPPAAGHVVQTIPAIFRHSDSGTMPDGRGGIMPAGAPGSALRDGWW